MRRLANLDKIRTVVDEALSIYIQELRLPGIASAELKSSGASAEQLARVIAQVEQHGESEIAVSCDVFLFLRVSNTDVLESVEPAEFLVQVIGEGDDLRAVANTQKDWAAAWARGIAPLRQAALESMRRDVRKLDDTLPEDSVEFTASMVLLASEFVGPYVDRISTFTGYLGDFVQVIGARLQEAEIWKKDKVRCEDWFDPDQGMIAFARDLLIAEGKVTCKWSAEEKQYVYFIVEALPS